MSEIFSTSDDAFMEPRGSGSLDENEEPVIDDNVQMDLHAYAAGYTGLIKYRRLIFIAKRCPSLKINALKLAHDYIKSSTLDATTYDRIFDMLIPDRQESADGNSRDGTLNSTSDSMGMGDASAPMSGSPILSDVDLVRSGQNEAGLVYDVTWVQKTNAKVMRTLEELETELKNFKVNTSKEYTRKASIELGDFCLKMGQLGNALKHYTRSRDYCISRQQDLNSCLNVVKVAAFQGAWSHVSAYVTLAENNCDSQEAEAAASDATINHALNRAQRLGCEPASSKSIYQAIAIARTKLAIVSGLVKLATADYREAAIHFLQANLELEDPTTDQSTSTMVTASDLAYYVTLCALATFERGELRSRVLGSPSFRLILESEVQCRDILTSFQSADYAACLQALEKVRPLLKLDIFLADRVDLLYKQIRLKSLCQYFTPYISADLNLMASAFRTTVAKLEDELASLIQAGSIKARIDSHRQLLCALSVDQRCLTFANAMQLVDDCQRRCHAAILRSNLARHSHTWSLSPHWQYEQRQDYPVTIGNRMGSC